MDGTSLRLVGDIGGTNARFALARTRLGVVAIEAVQHLRVADFATAAAAVAQYLGGLARELRPTDAVLAVAGPVVAGVADLTNAQGWHLDERVLARETALTAVRLINDFAALSLAVPTLAAGDLRPVGGTARIDAGVTVSLLGPGTGLGVGARVVDGKCVAILVTEGGHIAFAPADALERELLRVLQRRFGRVSLERILCGQGLVNLHHAFAEIEGREIPNCTPQAITDAAASGDAIARTTLDRFFAILGSAAGDVALIHGARGGVLLAGGILPRVADLLATSAFRARFEDKGRMSKLVRGVPTALIVAADVALMGAARG